MSHQKYSFIVPIICNLRIYHSSLVCYHILIEVIIMVLYPRQFGIVLKNARMDKKLTQAELAELLDISLSYLKDLERFRNRPSYEVFEKVIRYFNLSADTIIYPNVNLNNDTYQKIGRLLTRCDERQLKVILATTEALLSVSEKSQEPPEQPASENSTT